MTESAAPQSQSVEHRLQAATPTVSAAAEVAEIAQALIRIDTSNYGDGSGPGEREAAEYVVGLLREVGLEPQTWESAERRTTVAVRVRGTDRSLPGLCVHGHLDVVPANADDWSRPPFSGDIVDGMLWGRGAVDMKGMDAMMLAVIRAMAREQITPRRDLVWVFFADEEAAGTYGSKWMVENHPEVFEGVGEAISEVGGFSVMVQDTRAYLLQTAEKGLAWIHLTASGRAGHGSVPNDENAVNRLARALTRIDEHTWPRQYIASVRGLLDGLSEMSGVGYTDEDASELLALIPGARGFVEGTLQDTANATMLDAGYKHNVIPQTATASLDCRFLPGHEDDLLNTIRELAGEHVEVTIDLLSRSLETDFDGALVDAMTAAIEVEEPGAKVLPYCLSGGTDNKFLAELGITGYGFAPLQLPADLPFAPLFHGIDERVPVSALEFGTRVLERLVRSY